MKAKGQLHAPVTISLSKDLLTHSLGSYICSSRCVFDGEESLAPTEYRTTVILSIKPTAQLLYPLIYRGLSATGRFITKRMKKATPPHKQWHFCLCQ